jgi:hypothetical protein
MFVKFTNRPKYFMNFWCFDLEMDRVKCSASGAPSMPRCVGLHQNALTSVSDCISLLIEDSFLLKPPSCLVFLPLIDVGCSHPVSDAFLT